MKKSVPMNARLIPDNAERVFGGVIYDVYHWQQPMFDGSTEVFEMLKRADTVEVIAIEDGNLIFQHEEQPHAGKRYGLPGGRVDATDGSWLSAIKRECLEETGRKFKNWRLVSVVQPFSKIEWFVATYIAWGLESKGDVKHDAGEKITQDLLTLEKAKEICVHHPELINAEAILVDITNMDDLTSLPEFRGKQVER